MAPNLKVVIADLGSAHLASPDERFIKKPKVKDSTVPICTVHYRAPDVFLGSTRFGADLDMWSLGCVAAELFLRGPLFQPRQGSIEQPELLTLDAQFKVLGTPAKDTSTFAWMQSLPCFAKFYGHDGHTLLANFHTFPCPPKRLRGCPQQLEDFLAQTLKLRPQERWAAASARARSSPQAPCLSR